MKILVADDDAVSRLIIQRMLRCAGYKVAMADNGYAAVESLLNPDGPRLALLDWMMPGLDGPEVCREIRKRRDRPYIYITVLTSKEAKEDLVAGLEAGADDYLTKPCNAEELKARLRAGQRILQLEDTLVDAREQMRLKAMRDPLTSLWNREAILGHLNAELERSRCNQVPIAVLLCDVDYFKRINDVYGHLVGDKVLKDVARLLRSAVGPNGSVGRYGGEEFLIILSGCDEEGFRQRAERIRETVNASTFNTELGPLSVSVSLGAVIIGGLTLDHRPELLLSQADIALYRAKLEGRNRTIFVQSARSLEKYSALRESRGRVEPGPASVIS